MVKLALEAGTHVTVGISPELSVACGSSQTATLVGLPVSVLIVWFAGQEAKRGDSISAVEGLKKRSCLKINLNNHV